MKKVLYNYVNLLNHDNRNQTIPHGFNHLKKKKMKVKIKKIIAPAIPAVTVETEIEVQLPLYSCSDGHYFMIRPDGSLVRVVGYRTFEEQNICWYGPGELFWTPKAINGTIISREVFMEQYNKAMSKIQESEVTEEIHDGDYAASQMEQEQAAQAEADAQAEQARYEAEQGAHAQAEAEAHSNGQW